MTENFPAWIPVTHFLNLLFLTFMMRSGLEILSAHPKLYLNDDCTPGSEWLRLSRKRMPKDRLWTSRDEEESFPPWLALPGLRNLGLGRHWHFFTVVLWVGTGIAYWILLFASPQWRHLVPNTWSVFPDALRAMNDYLHGGLPPPGHPYNAVQQLSYFFVVYILGPAAIVTGAAMSPSIGARFPWYPALFGGRQVARSLHFLVLISFLLFIVVHVAMVIIHGFGEEMAILMFSDASKRTEGLVVGLLVLGVIAVFHVAASISSLRWPWRTERFLQPLSDGWRTLLLHHLTSRQDYSPDAASPYFRVNGRPPREPSYDAMAQNDFEDWALEVCGLVEQPLRLSLSDLRSMPKEAQVTKHSCIQGWTAVAEWGGVPMARIVDLCRPMPSARYAVFYAMDEKPRSEPDPEGPGYFYGTLDMELVMHPQTLLAYEMNGEPLPVPHGAPLRLRVESQLGFTMVKYLRTIEFVEDYRQLRGGKGGFREDVQLYSREASM